MYGIKSLSRAKRVHTPTHASAKSPSLSSNSSAASSIVASLPLPPASPAASLQRRLPPATSLHLPPEASLQRRLPPATSLQRRLPPAAPSVRPNLPPATSNCPLLRPPSRGLQRPPAASLPSTVWKKARTFPLLGLRGGLALKELRVDQSISDELALRKAEEAGLLLAIFDDK